MFFNGAIWVCRAGRFCKIPGTVRIRSGARHIPPAAANRRAVCAARKCGRRTPFERRLRERKGMLSKCGERENWPNHKAAKSLTAARRSGTIIAGKLRKLGVRDAGRGGHGKPAGLRCAQPFGFARRCRRTRKARVKAAGICPALPPLLCLPGRRAGEASRL